MHSTDPNQYWRFWKQIKASRDIPCTHGALDANIFAKYYIEHCKPQETPEFDHESMAEIESFIKEYTISDGLELDTLMNDILNAPISLEEAEHAFSCIKTGKANGIDGVPSECLKYASNELLRPITLLFNCIFDSGDYPEEWSEGIINPIYKHGAKTLPENYRKITVSTSIGKLFDSIINKRLVFYRRITHDEDKFQNGFKEKSRTIDNAFILNGIIEKYKANKKPLYICYVDFKSAFDHINRSALLYKLRKRGVSGKMLRILKDMFAKAKSSAKWGGYVSETFNNLYGVLQGGVTSPTLFNMFLEDLVNFLDVTCGVKMGDMMIAYLLFADDLVLISDTAEGLQKQIGGLYEFCRKWHMIVNLTKTKICVFNVSKKVLADYHFYYNGKEIEITDQYKYVGIIFSAPKNNFRKAHEHLANQARKAIHAIYKMSRDSIGDLSPWLKLKTFDAQVLPILEYGTEIWSTGSTISALESVQLKYLKQILGVKQQTSTLAVYGETGRFPLLLRQRLALIKYWSRVISMDPSSVLKCVYNEIYDLHKQGHFTWCSKVYNVLNLYNFGPVWDQQDNHQSSQLCISHFKEILYSRYMSDWCEAVQDSDVNPILRTYSLFKKDFQLEPYLLHVKDKHIRSAIGRFRTSSHILRIETGRHQKPKLDICKRTCLFCTTNDIDDEYHLLLTCQFHRTERAIFLSDLGFEKNVTLCKETFVQIMSDKNEYKLHILGRFLHGCFEKRKFNMVH